MRRAKAYRASAPLPRRRSALGGNVHGGSWGAATRQGPNAVRRGGGPRRGGGGAGGGGGATPGPEGDPQGVFAAEGADGAGREGGAVRAGLGPDRPAVELDPVL